MIQKGSRCGGAAACNTQPQSFGPRKAEPRKANSILLRKGFNVLLQAVSDAGHFLLVKQNTFQRRVVVSGFVMKLGLVSMAVMVGACSGPQRVDVEQSTKPIANASPLPSAAAIALVYDARVADLARLRSPVTMLIDRPGEDGSRERNQIEGSMQWELPMRMSLRGDKVGQTLFWVGSNETRYWSIDVGSDEKLAVIGTHEKLTPGKVASLGLPAHPLDVLEALCVTPLASEGQEVVVKRGRALGTIEASSKVRLGVVVTRVLDEKSFEPQRVELRTASGQTLLTATLSRFKSVPVVGKAFSPATIAGTIELTLPLEDTSVTLLLSDPQNPGPGGLRSKPFELDALLKAHDVKTVRDLDAEAGMQ